MKRKIFSVLLLFGSFNLIHTACLEHKIIIIPKNTEIEKKFINAIQKGNIEQVEKILKSQEININTKCEDGFPALMLAVEAGNKGMVELLIKYHVHLDEREDICGETALMWAACFQNAEIVRILVEAGANIYIESWTPSRMTALKYARDNAEIIRILTERRTEIK